MEADFGSEFIFFSSAFSFSLRADGGSAVGNSATCVWIENDIRVSEEMLRILVMSTQDMLSGKEPFPIVHPGGSWEVD